MLVVLGIGSNLGNREDQIRQAIGMLAENTLSAIRMSPVYESQAMLKPGAPEHWDMPFKNVAIAGETLLSPMALLKQVKIIERKIGRACTPAGLWAPETHKPATYELPIMYFQPACL